MKQQNEGSGKRQMFCRFRDGNSKIIRTSHGKSGKKDETPQDETPQDEREVLEKTCLAVGGFCQPQPYINLHQMLGISDDGFLDRISMCIVNSVILKEKEVGHWNEVLDSYSVTDLNDESIPFNLFTFVFT